MKEKKAPEKVKKVKTKSDKYRELNQDSFKKSLKRLNNFYTSAKTKAA